MEGARVGEAGSSLVEGDRGRRRWRASRPFPKRGRFWVLALSLVLLFEERAVIVGALARGQRLGVRMRSKTTHSDTSTVAIMACPDHSYEGSSCALQIPQRSISLGLLPFGRRLPVFGFRVGGGMGARGVRAGIRSQRLLVLELSKGIIEALGLGGRDGSRRFVPRSGGLLAFRAARRHLGGK